MTHFTVSPERITDTAGQVTSGADRIDDELSALRGQVRDLGTDWLGSASDAFQQLYEQWEQQARGLNQTLHEIAEQMRHAAARYVETEDGISTDLGSR